MSFAFIPSAVKKKKPVLVSSYDPSACISIGAQVTSESVDNSRGTNLKVLSGIEGRKSKELFPLETPCFDLEDLAQLVCLALSDYAIWADVDLRRKIDWGNNKDHYDDDTEPIHDVSVDDNNGCTSFHNLNLVRKS